MKLLYLHTESGGSYRIPGKHMDIKEEIMRYLTIALAKGRLALKAMDMFEQIGISCEEIVSYRITCNNGNQRTLINP